MKGSTLLRVREGREEFSSARRSDFWLLMADLMCSSSVTRVHVMYLHFWASLCVESRTSFGVYPKGHARKGR